MHPWHHSKKQGLANGWKSTGGRSCKACLSAWHHQSINNKYTNFPLNICRLFHPFLIKKRPFGGIILLLPILGWSLIALYNHDIHDTRPLRELIPATRLSNKDYATMLEAHG